MTALDKKFLQGFFVLLLNIYGYQHQSSEEENITVQEKNKLVNKSLKKIPATEILGNKWW